MPNTLAHLGIQALATRAVARDADPKWIYAGCVVPDVPWIAQRALAVLGPDLDPYRLRAYAIAQASLAASLLLCGALAALSRAPRTAFALLGANALLHLLLDALQTKWANGVHLWAPFSWELRNWGLFWPESLPTYLLTALGAAVVAFTWWRPGARPIGLRSPDRAWLAAGVLLLAWLLLPAALAEQPARADNHFLRTLAERERRGGRPVELDRVRYEVDARGGSVRVFAGERLAIEGLRPDDAAQVSIRGRFRDPSTVVVSELHVHTGWPRDAASYLGLALVAAFWLRDLLRPAARGDPGRPRDDPDRLSSAR